MISALLNAVPRWVWAALVAALAATSCKLKWDNNGLTVEIEKVRVVLEQERAAFAVAKADAADLYAETVEQYRAREQALQATADQARRERDVQVAASRRAADDLRERLLVYIDTPAVAAASYSPATAAAAARPFAPGSLGALLRDEAAAAARQLVDEAERADTIRLELMRCYRQYDEAATP